MHFGRCHHEAALAAWEPGAGSTQQGQIGRGLFMLPSSPPHLPAPLTITFICRWLVGERCRLWPGAARANRLPEDPSPGLSLISVLWFPNVQVSWRFSMPRRDLRGGRGMFFPTLVTMPCPRLNFKVTKLEHIFSSSKGLFLLHSLFLSMIPATSWPPA